MGLFLLDEKQSASFWISMPAIQSLVVVGQEVELRPQRDNNSPSPHIQVSPAVAASSSSPLEA
jgi:hypothetical protein